MCFFKKKHWNFWPKQNCTGKHPANTIHEKVQNFEQNGGNGRKWSSISLSLCAARGLRPCSQRKGNPVLAPSVAIPWITFNSSSCKCCVWFSSFKGTLNYVKCECYQPWCKNTVDKWEYWRRKGRKGKWNGYGVLIK
jgi:hypothetical protein